MKNITQTTKDFADYIMETKEFTELKEATQQLDKNKEAGKILEEVQAKKQTMMTLQQTGLPVSSKQQQELEFAFFKMRENAVCMRFVKAQNLAHKLARQVSNQLTQETGIPFTSGGGCCG